MDLDNLRAALASGLRDDPRCALHIAVALWPLWMRRGYFTEGARLLDAALAADTEPTQLRARGVVAASALAVRLARQERIVALAEEARVIQEQLGDDRGVATALLYQGVTEAARTRNAVARRSLERAHALALEVGDPLVAAESRHAQGVEAHCRGDDATARSLMEEGLQQLAEARDSDSSYGPRRSAW